jgi:hypothetical protein
MGILFYAIASWINKYTETVSARAEFANCGADEVTNIARDVGVSPKSYCILHTKDRTPPMNYQDFSARLETIRRSFARPTRR